MNSAAPPVILASGSRWRARELERFGLPFRAVPADIDESPLPSEDPAALAPRLARAKAARVQAAHRDAIVIGSDQVAVCAGAILGKPGTAARARAQLRAASGRELRFCTALCVLAPGNAEHEHLDITLARFRVLGDAEIERYVARETPLDCAGSFRCEGLGISLFEAIETHDPSALVGLPLIALARMLRVCGLAVP